MLLSSRRGEEKKMRGRECEDVKKSLEIAEEVSMESNKNGGGGVVDVVAV